MWKQLPSGRVEHRFELPVLVAALALIPVLIIENFAKGQTWQDFAWAANWVIWAVFAAELAFILMRSSLCGECHRFWGSRAARRVSSQRAPGWGRGFAGTSLTLSVVGARWQAPTRRFSHPVRVAIQVCVSGGAVDRETLVD